MPQTTVSIFDTTLRDGEQSPGCSMNLTEKVRMANKLQDLGVDIIEAGFPIASEGDFAAVKAIAAQCQDVKVAALCRTAEQDVARAAEALRYAARPRIHTFCATSDIHLEHKLKKTRAEVIAMTRAAVRLARNYADDVEFSAEDATRSISITCVKCWTRRSRRARQCSTFPTRLGTRRRTSTRASSNWCASVSCAIAT